MISKNKVAKWVFASTFAAVMMVPAIALAQETAAAAAAPVDWRMSVGKAFSAAIAMAVSAFSAGYAQSRIGAAAAGTLAERPEAGTNLIVLQALPEVIVLLGFVIAFMINAA
jgi:V/A-type H+/Na+-transporting ATPase subunit K